MIQLIYNSLTLNRDRFDRNEASASFYQLSRMLSAGVALDEALNDLSHEDTSRSCQRRWKNVARSVGAGNTLSSALSARGYTKDNTIIALLVAGESSGELDVACESVYQYLHWHSSLQRRMVTLLIYPLFSVVVLLLVMGFLFVSVVPSLESYLLSTGSALPWHTRVLLDMSGWMKSHYLICISLCAAVLLIVLILWVKNPGVRKLIDRCLQRMPILGSVITRLILSRYIRCVAQLYSCGVTLEKAMLNAEGTITNVFIHSELASARKSVLNGATLAESMRAVTVLPALFKRLIAVGENSGKLGEIFTLLAEQQSADAQTAIERVEQLIAPFILLFIGSMLLWIVVSVLGPVYSAAIATAIGAL